MTTEIQTSNRTDQIIKVTNKCLNNRQTSTFESPEMQETSFLSTATYTGTPYSNVVNQMQELKNLESPMTKLEWIYMCCTTEVTKEISAFWKEYDIP